MAYCRCNVTVCTYHGSMLVLLLSLISLAYFAGAKEGRMRRGERVRETVTAHGYERSAALRCLVFYLPLGFTSTTNSQAQLEGFDVRSSTMLLSLHGFLCTGQPAASCFLFVDYGNKSAEYFSGYCSSGPIHVYVCVCM